MVLVVHSNNLFFFGQGNFVTHGLHLFFMPIFFMASGFVGYKVFVDNYSFDRFLQKKMYTLLVPFFVFGLGYSFLCGYLEGNANVLFIVKSFIMHGMNNGYWFILVLFVIKFLCSLTSFLFCKFQIRKVELKLIISLVLSFSVGFLAAVYIPSLKKVAFYAPFFILGAWFRIKDLHNYIVKSHEIFLGAAFVMLMTLYTFMYLMGAHFKPIYWLALQFIPTIFVFILIYKSDCSKGIMGVFSRIGTISLDIYVLHYFCLLGFTPDTMKFFNYDNLPLLPQTALLIAVALIILFFTIVLSKIFNSNSFLKFLLGKF
ncbi:MAG: acyltransferase [Fibrobacter sp.]|nr:acyltransferase [Fibrobacter sp.]